MRTLLQRSLAAVFIIAIFGLGVAVDSVSNKRRHAEQLVGSMAALKAGTSSFAEARELAEAYEGKPESAGSKGEDCSVQACTFSFVIDNRPLNYIPGVGAVRLVATLGVRNGYVMQRDINYTILNNAAGVDFAYVLADHPDASGFAVQKLKVDSAGKPHVLKVNLGPSATADERQRAYSIEFTCLARLRGCRDASAVFPARL